MIELRGRRRVIITVILIMLFLALTNAAPTLAQDRLKTAKITSLSGEVKVMKAGGEKLLPAYKGMGLTQGDRIITGKNSWAELEIDSDKEVRISEKTQIGISELTESEDANTEKSKFNLLAGSVWGNVKKKLNTGSKFEIKTPVAVMGVRGTKIYLTHNEQGTKLTVVSGTTALTSSKTIEHPDGTKEEVAVEFIVAANEQIALNERTDNQEQGKIEQVTPESLDLELLEIIREIAQEEPELLDPSLAEIIDRLIEERREEKQAEEKLDSEKDEEQQSSSTITYAPEVEESERPESSFSGGGESPSRPTVSINELSNTTVEVGQIKEILVTTCPEDCTITADSDDPSVVSVEVNGRTIKLAGAKRGSTNINVRANRQGYYEAAAVFQVDVTGSSDVELLASGIISLEAPERNATNLTFPALPEGYTISIKTSSNPEVIRLDGKIVPPLEDTTVTLVFTVTKSADNLTADTAGISVEVPAGEYGSISGTVKDKNGNNLSEVNVNLNKGEEFIADTFTDNNGQYSFHNVLSGNGYQVCFSKLDYLEEKIENIEVQTGVTNYLQSVTLLKEGENLCGKVEGYITNALDGSGIAGLEVNIRRGLEATEGDIISTCRTSENGYYSFAELEAGNYTGEIKGEGYITGYFSIICIAGEIKSEQNATVTPELAEGETRIVLTWGESPRDLDSYLTGPAEEGSIFKVYYGSKTYQDAEQLCVQLDVDDTSSFGPETTTIYKQIAGTYKFFVHNYSCERNLASSEAQVKVFRGDLLVATFNVPTDQEGVWWKVFELNGQTVTPVNTVSNSFENSRLMGEGLFTENSLQKDSKSEL